MKTFDLKFPLYPPPDVGEKERNKAMNEKMKAYILNNHDKYGIHNEKGELLSRDEMLALLNMLEANGENLESLHDASFNNRREFCGIYGSFDNDDDTYRTMMAFHFFYPTVDDLLEHIETVREEYWNDDLEENIEYYGDFASYFKMMWDDEIIKTSDGWVRRIEY